MALGNAPEPTVPSSPSTYPAPSRSDLAAVAATVSVVGILMAILVTWLVFRLRRASKAQSQSIPISHRPASYPFRPSFAPSEASSKFGFSAYTPHPTHSPSLIRSPVRKPLRLSRRHKDTSWDFADPDPFAHPKESSFDTLPPPSPKHRPAPLPPAPAYTPRAQRTSTYKDASGPRTPTTPDFIDPPPPAYCRDSSSWPISQPKDFSPT